MDKDYSNSKLELYQNCPEAFKVKYIDKTFPKIPKGIQLFLGEMVHESLEWLYIEIKKGNKVELDDLVFHFANNWQQNFSFDTRVNEGNAKDYLDKGIKFLIDYHAENSPFKENTIATEKSIIFNLQEYAIRGYVDRIVLNSNNEYEIHDYKTNKRIKTQEEIDDDRQLAFYHIGLQGLFGKDIKVKLIWHFLAHKKIMSSSRTDKQLEKIKAETFELIKKIESTTFWPACGSRWCDWCEYKRAHGIKKVNSFYGLDKFLCQDS